MLPTSQSKYARAHAEARRKLNAGRFPEALRDLRGLLKLDPKHPALLYDVARAEVVLGQVREARAHVDLALRASPRNADTHAMRAQICLLQGDLDEALASSDRALAIRPRHQYALAQKGEILHAAGRAQEGYDLLAPIVAAGERDPNIAGVFAKCCRSIGEVDRGCDAIRAALDAQQAMPPARRAQLRFQLGQLLDAGGRYDEAWEVFVEANDYRSLPFDPAADAAMVDGIISAWSTDALAALPRARTETAIPVFIIGMPRSGTSLVEQILAAHPAVHGGGELTLIHDLVAKTQRPPANLPGHLTDVGTLTRPAVERMSRSYLRDIRRLGPKAQRITDKMPHNFLNLGLITLMFPQARIIHCTRDPMDTLLSCYFQSFVGTLYFTNDLEHLGAVYRGYQRLMAHWKEVLDAAILDVPYEALVEDQEGWTRRLLDFLGLPWDDACLRYYESERITLTASIEQVRRPIYTSSIGRHRHYNAHLGPLRAALGMPPECRSGG